MIGIVLVTHGQLGSALLQTAETVLEKKPEGVVSLRIDPLQPVTSLRKSIKQSIKSVANGQGVLLLTDMFGGTPSNLAYSFLEEGVLEVVSGVNLPVLLRAVSLRENHELAALAREVEDYGKKSIYRASSFLKGNKAATDKDLSG